MAVFWELEEYTRRELFGIFTGSVEYAPVVDADALAVVFRTQKVVLTSLGAQPR